MSHRADVRRHRRDRPAWRIGIGVLCLALVATAIGVRLHQISQRPPTTVAVDDTERTGDRASRGEARPSATAAAAPSPVAPKATPRAATPAPTRAATTTAAPRTTLPAACTSYPGNRKTACGLLPSFGFALGQMAALDELWEHESNWNHLAENPSSGAYGIPQALPADKMASAGSDWRTNPATQIRWGLGYIKDRYGTPAEAWEFWQANNWY